MVKIPLASSNYTAQLRGVTGTNTAGQTLQGSFNSSDSLFHFSPSVTGRYELWVDALGGSAYVKDALWSGANGRVVMGAPDVEKLVALSANISGSALDSAGINSAEVKLVHLGTDITAKLDSTANPPDNVTIGINIGGKLYVLQEALTGFHIEDSGIENPDLDDNAVDSRVILNGQVFIADLAPEVTAKLDSTGYPPDGVTIGLNGSGQLQVENDGLGAQHLATNTFLSSQFQRSFESNFFWEIKSLGITTNLFADNSITLAKMAADAVNSTIVDDSTLTWQDVHPTSFFGPDFYVESPLGLFRWAIADNAIRDDEIAPNTAVKRINNFQDTVNIVSTHYLDVVNSSGTIDIRLGDDIPGIKILSESINYTQFDNETNNALFHQRVFHPFSANANIISFNSPGAVSAPLNFTTFSGNSTAAYAFDNSSKKSIKINFFSPERALGDSCFVYFSWFSLTQDPGLHSVVWQVDGMSYANGSNQGQTFDNENTGTFFCEAGKITVSQLKLHTGNNFISNMSDNNIRFVRLYDDANDTHGETVYLISVFIEYNISNEL